MDIEALLDGAREERQKRGRSPSVDSASSYGSSFASRSSSPDPTKSKWLETLQGKPPGQQSSNGGNHHASTSAGVSVDTEMKGDSIGARMLAKMGWKAGQGLGVENQGRVDPIRAAEQIGFTGLGKTEQDKHMMTAATFKPRELASARQERETNDQKRAREEANVKKQQTHEQVADMLEKFFCDICNKGYKSVSQWEEHIRSYAHNHAKRKVDIAQQQKAAKANSGEAEKRKERERKREEKEMRKMGISAGLSLKPTVGQSSQAGSTAATSSNAGSDKPKPSGFKPVGGGGFKKVGAAAGGASTSGTAGGVGWARASGSVPAQSPSSSSSNAQQMHAPPSIPPPPAPPGLPSGRPPPPPPSPSQSSQAQAQAAPTFQPAAFKRATPSHPAPPAHVPKPHEWLPANAAPIHPMLAGASTPGSSNGHDSSKPAPLSGANSGGRRPTAASMMDMADEEVKGEGGAGLVRPQPSGPKPGFKIAFNKR